MNPDDGDRVAELTRALQQARDALQARERMIETETQLRLQAERANRAKDELLATASHELRTPLNAMRGWAFLLGKSGALDAAAIERAAQAIQRGVDRQARLIDDLLDTARILSGEVQLQRHPVDLPQITEDAIGAARPHANAQGIDLRLHVDAPAVFVAGDAVRLRQVLDHLLANAMKLAGEGGALTIRIRVEDNTARIFATASGVGIDSSLLSAVLERASRSDSASGRKHAGVGLVLARHLVELHGGTITARSEEAGKGASFVVALPCLAGSSG